MAIIYPSFNDIQKLKVKPEQSELYLLKYFEENLSNTIEVYFQPYLNGDNPDIILIEKDVGVAIVEVKDWDLNSYYLDENGEWHVKNNNAKIKSPFKQVFQYKDNMFSLHINGLLEKKILDKRFYGRIAAFVYFHNISYNQLKQFYQPCFEKIEVNLNLAFSSNNKKQIGYLNNLKTKLLKQRDYYSKTEESLKHIQLPKAVNGLFTASIYKEFIRYLQPPFHSKDQGSQIYYTEKQLLLSESVDKHQKIKGVAGSGKTLILAKRAVNAHKRHGGNILILTFNITLTSYIHDMISNVREDFSWNVFTILNYHHFFNMMANNYGLEIQSLEDYNNEDFFNGLHINKYKTILIDEIQDYEENWIRCIKNSFLAQDGELVVFGDEKQNIYDRKLAEDKKPNTTIVGGWNLLNESFRLDTSIAKLAEKFQEQFFINKYDTDKIQIKKDIQSSINYDVNIIDQKTYDQKNLRNLVEMVFEIVRKNNIHPNDICLISYHINLLRDIDYIIRREFNERTLTTFETAEVAFQLSKTVFDQSILNKEIQDIRKNKKYAFQLNSGVMKLSTVQSFKGWEIPTLFLIIDSDSDEVIYTAITRAKHNIIVFNIQDNKYYKFFNDNILLE